MKFSVATTVMALFAATAAQAANIESRVVVKGLSGKPSKADLDVLGKALVSSYNDANWESEHKLSGEHQTAIETSLRGGMEFSIVTPVGICRFCYDDDDAKNAVTSHVEICRFCYDDDASAKSEIQALEESFCNKIKASESKFFANAKECSIEFVDEKKTKAVAVADAPVAPATLQSHVVLQGVLNDISEEDTVIIRKALVSAYNDANWDSKYHMSDAKTDFKTTVPLSSGICRFCYDDDSAKAKGAKGIYVTLNSELTAGDAHGDASDRSNFLLASKHAVQICRFCYDDDAAADAMTLFQNSFCDKIKNSSSANLRSANVCSVTVAANEETAVTSK